MDFSSLGSRSSGYGPNAQSYRFSSPQTPLENIVVVVNESQIVKAILPYASASSATSTDVAAAEVVAGAGKHAIQRRPKRARPQRVAGGSSSGAAVSNPVYLTRIPPSVLAKPVG